jgi:large subunit ribosomal protein L21
MQMYVVIKTGGKQYRVKTGDILQIEKIEGEEGGVVTFDEVLFGSARPGDATGVVIGKPQIASAMVQGEILAQGRGEKVLVFKMKRRKQYRRTQGHRQEHTQVLVTKIAFSGNDSMLEASAIAELKRKFVSRLKPKGLAFSPKMPGPRARARALDQAE